MGLFEIIAVLLTMAALFSYLNHHLIGFPTTIGVMLIALLMSLGLLVVHAFGVNVDVHAAEMLQQVDFNQTLLHGMLAFLLFAGALHVDLGDLIEYRGIIALLASVGVIISTAIIGFFSWGVLRIAGFDIGLAYCFVFGALISPTDPIAVLGILKQVGVAKALEVKITGESLFNDGFGVVIFIALLDVAAGAHGPDAMHIALLFAEEALGGAALGIAAGLLAYFMLRSLDNYQVEVMITLALVTGTYALADRVHLSGPIAIVVAGLLIGNQGRALAMSEETQQHLDTFWELTDEILNAVLFVLIGLEVLILELSSGYIIAGIAMIPVVLAARWISVSIPVRFFSRREFAPGTVTILTWGGLRGGISVALALSLPHGAQREVLVAVTYCIVVFSVVVQGLTIGPVIRRLGLGAADQLSQP